MGRIEVDAPMLGLELSAPGGVETEAAPRRENEAELLYKALNSPETAEAPLQIARAFFAGGSGKSALVSNVSVLARDVEAAKTNDGVAVAFSGLLRVLDLEGERPPVYDHMFFSTEFSTEDWEAVQSNPRSFLQSYKRVLLPPGRYQWELAWHDRISGRVGVYRTQVDAPDLSGASNLSPLWLGVERAPGPRRLVALNPNRLSDTPPDEVYVRGERMLAELWLANATRQDFDRAEGSRLRVYRAGAGESVAQTRFRAELVPSVDRINFRASIATETLEPGEYRVVATLPDGRESERRMTVVSQ